jgi:S-adenosylmethionine hydrolase
MSVIALFSDYGTEGPYVGQVHAAIHAVAPDAKIVDLQHDAPRNNPRASAYLLAALAPALQGGTVLFCVVDPGVGTGRDEPVVMDLDGRRLVGPDNGLFDIAVRRAAQVKCSRIRWRPAGLSKTFHGRDLYAPVCAILSAGRDPGLEPRDWRDAHGWPDDPAEIINPYRWAN